MRLLHKRRGDDLLRLFDAPETARPWKPLTEWDDAGFCTDVWEALTFHAQRVIERAQRLLLWGRS